MTGRKITNYIQNEMQKNRFLSVTDYRNMVNQIFDLKTREKAYLREAHVLSATPSKSSTKIQKDALEGQKMKTKFQQMQ